MQQLAGQQRVSSFVHGRFSSQTPPTSGLLGIDEMMAPQATYGGGLVVQHMTAQTLAVTPQALQFIDDAREKGIKVIAEIYPYDFGGTIAGADYLHPHNYQTNMGRDYKDIIEVSTMKPLTKARYEELVKTAPGTWLTGIILLAGSMPTVASDVSSVPEDWQLGAEVYFWGASIGGTSATGGDIDIGIDDLLDNLEMAIMGAFGARKENGRWRRT